MRGVPVVPDVAGGAGEDGVVSAHGGIFTGVPESAALSEDYVPGFDEFTCSRGVRLCVGEEEEEEESGEVYGVPAVFLAPNLFPGPSFPLFAGREALWVAHRTADTDTTAGSFALATVGRRRNCG